MNHLEPRTSHPLLWILEQLFGLSLEQVADETSLSRTTLRKIREGKPPKTSQVHALADAIIKVRNALARELSPPYSILTRRILEAPHKFWHRSSELTEWRKMTFRFINGLVELYTHPAIAQPRQTVLGEELLIIVGKGKPQDLVFQSFRTTQRKHIRKLAARIGLRVVPREDGKWWLPPADLPAITTVKMPDVPPVMRSTKRGMRLQNALVLFLGDYPDGVDSKVVVSHVMQRARCSRPAVFRTARDLRVVREITGFGPTKKSIWTLPPALRPKKPSDDGNSSDV